MPDPVARSTVSIVVDVHVTRGTYDVITRDLRWLGIQMAWYTVYVSEVLRVYTVVKGPMPKPEVQAKTGSIVPKLEIWAN